MLGSEDNISSSSSSMKDDRIESGKSEGEEKLSSTSCPGEDLIPYEIFPCRHPSENSSGNADLYKVLFTLPTNEYVDIDQLIEKPIAARGCYFTLEKGSERQNEREMGKITCTFESAFPEDTAKAIGMKIAARIRNPTPDGVGDACIIA